MKTFSMLSLGAALVALSFPAAAEDAKPMVDKDGKPAMSKRFIETDTNKDGFLTKDEMLEEHKKRIEDIFTRLDTDKDGKLSPEEMKAGREKMRERMKERREKMMDKKTDGDKPTE